MEFSKERQEEIKALFALMERVGNRPAPKDAFGYGQGQKKVLMRLLQHPEGITSGELASLCEVGSGRIANILKDWEKKGIVSREAGTDDKRQVIVKMTEKGLGLSNSITENFARITNRLIERWGDDNFNEFLRLANEMNSIMETLYIEENGKHVQSV